MSDSKIPIKKLVDSSGYYYYPLTTVESVFTSQGITVKNTIGSYRPNDTIDSKTSLQSILVKILTEPGEVDSVLHLSNVDIDSLSEYSTRVPSSLLMSQLFKKFKENLEAKLVSVARYKGSVDYYNDLPTDTAEVGDIYNVKYRGTSGTDHDGNNYIYDGSTKSWDKMSGFVDLSDFYTREDIDSLRLYIDNQDNSIRNEYVKKSDATGTINAEVGKCITGITQTDGKITSVTSATLGTDVVVNPLFTNGEKIGDIIVDGNAKSLYTPYTSGVVETWKSGYNWYRLYSDGWIEQGGIITCETSSKSLNIPFHKEMSDSYCSVQITQDDSTGSDTILSFKKIHNESRIIVSWNEFSTPTFDWKCTGFTNESPVVKYTVTFNANGGSVFESSRNIVAGSAIGTLPEPEYSGYDFTGWYTDSTSGTKISSSTIITSPVTYYAHWTLVSSDDILVLEEDSGQLVVTEDKLYNIDLSETSEQNLSTEIQHDPVTTEDKLNFLSLKPSTEKLLTTEVLKEKVNTEDHQYDVKL